MPIIQTLGQNSALFICNDRVKSLKSANLDFKDEATKKITFQFQCVTWKLEKALVNFPFEHFDISEEVQEQVRIE